MQGHGKAWWGGKQEWQKAAGECGEPKPKS